MQNRSLKPKIFNFGLCLLFCGLCGCAVVDYVKPEQPPYDEHLPLSYYHINLKASSAADVLSEIHIPEYEQLSQSRSVIASSGQKKKGHEVWLKMAAFDENTLTINRKYFFLVDEKPKNLWIQPKRRLRFDSEMVLGSDILDEPYANDNAKRIAILNQVLANVRNDIEQVSAEDKNLRTCGMLINQTLRTILVKVESSPVSATKLNPVEGLDFDHISLGAGKVWMGVAGDTVSIRIRINSYARTHDNPFSLVD